MSNVPETLGDMQWYQILRGELLADPLGYGYASMTHEEAANKLNEKTRSRVVTAYRSRREVAETLTEQEYSAFKQKWQVAAAQSDRVAALTAFFDLPCAPDGHNGGINFGHPTIRSIIQGLDISAEAKQKLLSLGEEPCSRAEELGLGYVYPGHVESARNMQ